MTADLYAVIWFHKNYVTNIETYQVKRRQLAKKSCADYFKNIKWDSAPAPNVE
jgi:hypothetical protein